MEREGTQGGLNDIESFVGEFERRIAGNADDEGVVAEAALHGIGSARAAVQGVVAGAADQIIRAGATDDHIVAAVADAGERAGAGIEQLFDVRLKRQRRQGGLHHVDALVREFDDRIASGADDIKVVADAALQRVARSRAADQRVVAAASDQVIGARAAIENIVSAIADQRVGKGRARDVFHMRERVGAAKAVGAAARREIDGNGRGRSGVVGGIDSLAAIQRIAAGAAGERVVARPAHHRVVAAIAGAVEVARARICQILHIRGQGIGAEIGLNLIDAFNRRFDDRVARDFDRVDVVSGPALQRVGLADAADQRIVPAAADQIVASGAADQRVVAGAADDHVVGAVARAGEVAGSNEGQVLQIHRQDERVQRGLPGIDPFAREFQDGVADRCDDIGVVSGSALQCVGLAGAAGQNVVAGAADQILAAGAADERVGKGRPDNDLDPAQRVGAAIAVAAGIAGGEVDVHASGRRRIVHRVGAGAADQRVVAGVADQRIVAAAAVQRVVAGAAIERVVGGIARYLIVAAAAFGVFDERARVVVVLVGVGDLARRANARVGAVDERQLRRREGGEFARQQIDAEVGGVVRQIVCVGSVSIPDRLVDRVGRRSALTQAVDEHFAGGRAPGIDGVSRIRAEVGAIHVLERRDVVGHVGLIAAAGLVSIKVVRSDIGMVIHDRPAGGVVRGGKDAVHAVVLLSVFQTQRMPELVHEGVELVSGLGRRAVADIAEKRVAARVVRAGIVGVGGRRVRRPGEAQSRMHRVGFGNFGEQQRRVLRNQTQRIANDVLLRGCQHLKAAGRRRVGVARAVVRRGGRKAVGQGCVAPRDAAEDSVYVLVREIAGRSDRCRVHDGFYRRRVRIVRRRQIGKKQWTGIVRPAGDQTQIGCKLIRLPLSVPDGGGLVRGFRALRRRERAARHDDITAGRRQERPGFTLLRQSDEAALSGQPGLVVGGIEAFDVGFIVFAQSIARHL